MQNRGDDRAASNRNRQLEFLVNAKEQLRIALMVKANVIGIGVGQRTRKGQTTDELVLKVYVSHKIPKELLAEADLVPPTLQFDNRKVAIDVEESDIPKAQIFNLRLRPIIGGSSIGPLSSDWVGTLGVCVTLDDGRTYILSNYHILAIRPTWSFPPPPFWPFTMITQPGRPDGGTSNDIVAILHNSVPIDFGTFSVTIGGVKANMPKPNYVDCALALVPNGFNGANREIHWIGYPASSTIDPKEIGIHKGFFDHNLIFPSKVCKMGRTTEYTVGNIVDISWDGLVDYSDVPGISGKTTAMFQDQLKVVGEKGHFSLDGDSGSLVLTLSDLRPVGLLFAGNEKEKFTLCNYISSVTRALGIPRI